MGSVKPATKPDVSVKVVLLGESLVGKTSFANIVSTGVFNPNILSTIGASFQSKQVKVEQKTVNLNIWDTAGQEHYRSLTPLFYRDADIVILVYSIDNRRSFTAIKSWYMNLQYDCTKMPLVYIIANKLDLDIKREVSTEEGFELASKLNSSFYELSSRTQIDKVFDIINNIAVKAYSIFGNKEEQEAKVNIVKSTPENEHQSCC